MKAGAVIAPGEAQEAASLWHEGQVVHIAGAGNAIHEDRQEAFVAAVKAFLTEAEA